MIRLAYAAPISYVYDDLGRLIAVIDEASDTAIYEYDAVGNLLSITRQASSTVKVLEFQPKTGPVGATVTISGTAFSATPSQNTVTFNGTAATITSASLTQLVATVPSGASTGAIGVMAPGGSSTSATNFTVTATDGVPTITNFSPAIGVPGAAVTVTGTNYDLAILKNKLGFNASYPRQAKITTATATTLATTVPPQATSGHLRVVTENGAAESTQDFFVPPAPYLAADVMSTGRVAIGGASLALTIGTANKIALAVFDGTAGQRLGLGITSHTLGTTSFFVKQPDGTNLATILNTSLWDLPPLVMTGTHTIMVDPTSAATGSTTVTLSEELTGPITIGGSAVTLTISRPGQRARYTFTGTGGQRLNLRGSSSSISDGNLTILKPDGSTLGGATLNLLGADLYPPVLPSTGTYTILVDPSFANTGNLTLTLSEEIVGTITLDGASVTSSIGRIGQRARYTFEGTAGQRLNVGVSNSSITVSTVSVQNPDGSTLTSAGVGPSGAVDTPVLPSTGIYTLLLDPSTDYTGSATLTLSTEVTGSITAGGPAVTVTLSRPGQRARLTFSGTATQRVSVVGGSGTISTTNVSIINPDGSTLGTVVNFPPTGGFMDTRTLIATGSHTLLLDPTGVATGDKTVTLHTVPADVTGALTINGAAANVSLTTPGQNAQHTFSATSGQGITVRVTNNTAGCTTFSLKRPDGIIITSTTPCGATGNLPHTPTMTGTYTILSDPNGANTGTFDLAVTNP